MSVNYPEFLESLGAALRSRFELRSMQKDLNDSVAMHQKALGPVRTRHISL